jgi:hypothetical protein
LSIFSTITAHITVSNEEMSEGDGNMRTGKHNR